MQPQKQKQNTFPFDTITISSNFESGNLQAATMPCQNQFNLWIGSDHKANNKTWFYFSVEGVKVGATVTFTVMNMNNQIKLFKEGHVPVFRTVNNQRWGRIKIPIAPNAVNKVQQGFQIIFKHTFTQNCKHYFAFTYPWTNQQNNAMIQNLMPKTKSDLFCHYQKLCNSYRGRPVMLLTVTKSTQKQLKFQMKKISNNQIFVFPSKKGIFISARVHPGQTASSHIMNGIIQTLLTKNQLSNFCLQSCVFYIIAIINPDGVAEGNFRNDCQGKNLNRYYTNPGMESEPEIFYIKQFLVNMIKEKRIQFCLDLHAHVNKQGAFIYGNSTSSLYGQMRVCLFPKLLSFNSQIFDFQSCNFSEKNMCSKDKGDQLSKQGASRVAIFRDTGLVQCWTLQCNYNSARITHVPMQPTGETKNSNLSNIILTGKVQPEYKDQIKYLNIQDFNNLGKSIVQSICDFYSLKTNARIFNSKLKNMNNVIINTTIVCLRLIPFRFDNQCRKILDWVNGGVNFKVVIQKIEQYLGNIQIKGHSNSVSSTSRQIKSQKDASNSNSKRQISNGGSSNNQKIKVTSLKKPQKQTTKQIHSFKILNFEGNVKSKTIKIPTPPPMPPKKQVKKQSLLKNLLQEQKKIENNITKF